MKYELHGTKYICRSIKLYNYLSMRGYEPLDTQVNKFDSKRLVWVYRLDDSLKQAIDNYYEMM